MVDSLEPKHELLSKRLSEPMGLISGFEFILLLAIVGFLFVLGMRAARGSGSFNLLLIFIIGILLLVVFSLGRLVLAFFSFTAIAILAVVLFAAMIFLRLIRR